MDYVNSFHVGDAVSLSFQYEYFDLHKKIARQDSSHFAWHSFAGLPGSIHCCC